MTRQYLLAIDQGTTNSRAIIFHRSGQLIAQHDLPLQQFFPNDGWVEQNPEEMFDRTLTCCRQAIAKSGLAVSDIAAIGLTNQRETTILWEKHSGRPIYPAIVWQDRRTSQYCADLSADLSNAMIQAKTGLLLDPYFSATKIAWILDHVPSARARAARGELLFGTVDTYLLWRLTGGLVHATDASNASRTLLFNIHDQTWDADLLKAFNIPENILPSVMDNTADFGMTVTDYLGEALPILGMAGDQQAATIGQACFHPGMVKSTYGTGCFMLLNTGDHALVSQHQLLTTIAYRIQGKVTYGLEGSIFSAGATIKWFRDTLHLIQSAAESEHLAMSVPNTGGVYLIPAFTGLGAPHWDPEARGALLGLTRNTQRAHIIRAALEAAAYQTRDLLMVMSKDAGSPITALRVDGGMTPNHWLMQFLADMLGITVTRPRCVETTALGAAYLAGLQAGLYSSLSDIEKCWESDRIFKPAMEKTISDALYQGWNHAIEKVLSE
ncbi:MAG TPA: glycerol kinase GlpK [Gammaproteobacteria bacterium]|jgi:glycerol kinase|nr:glycerol kinase GlpK [Gammaproteobacteria bacterium]